MHLGSYCSAEVLHLDASSKQQAFVMDETNKVCCAPHRFAPGVVDTGPLVVQQAVRTV